MREKKREEYDYWFRVMNEGVLPSDSLPYYKQLVAYKDFASQVEERAYETLKLTVQRLMLDFEEQEGLNVVAEFAEGDKETKHKALKRLIALVND